jgi:hypothetical protein
VSHCKGVVAASVAVAVAVAVIHGCYTVHTMLHIVLFSAMIFVVLRVKR